MEGRGGEEGREGGGGRERGEGRRKEGGRTYFITESDQCYSLGRIDASQLHQLLVHCCLYTLSNNNNNCGRI
jgi:hypothetical protein